MGKKQKGIEASGKFRLYRHTEKADLDIGDVWTDIPNEGEFQITTELNVTSPNHYILKKDSSSYGPFQCSANTGGVVTFKRS